MYGATSYLMPGNYMVPMAAKLLDGGTTQDDESHHGSPRRSLGGGEYRPDYDPEDPFHTPIGDVPVMMFMFLAAMVTYWRIRRQQETHGFYSIK